MLRVEFREIEDIRIACSNCKAEIVLPLEREIPKFLECPGCNKRFWGDGQMKTYAYAQNISASLRNWKSADRSEFSLSFSLPCQKEAA
jgi:uncharacterized protein with PIN domain